MRNLKICFPVSSGGHLTQVYILKEWWEKYDRFWVTFDKMDAHFLLKGERVYHAKYPTNRNIKNLIKNTFIAWRILLKERPDIIFSTGAGVAVPFYYLGKLLGAKLLFMDVINRVDSPTLTGKLVYPIVDHLLIQWKELKVFYPKGEYWGQAF